MQYVSFPGHPLPVSRICLGTMMFGDKCNGALSEAIVARALELGINAFDTAAMYSAGASEQYLGRALKSQAREQLFVTTKVVKGIDRRSIVESIDESLARLQMDYVDLYLIHWPVVGMNLTEMMAGLERRRRGRQDAPGGLLQLSRLPAGLGQCDRRRQRLGPPALQPSCLQPV